MSKINCSLIKDLLPLYIDDLCSKETTEIVGNHLEICEDCNKEYETLKTEPKVKPQQDNSQELIKKVNKKFGKDKKWAVIKTVSIILVVIILISIVAFLKVPLYLAQNYFVNENFFSMACNYEEWETHNTEKSNYENEFVKLYIDEKYGDYTETIRDDGATLSFGEDKKISILDNSFATDAVPSFDDEFEHDYYSNVEYPILLPFIKKGLENMEIDTSITPGANVNFYHTLITREIPWVKFFCSLDEYYDACAYYGMYMVMMPSGGDDSYYIINETEDAIAWGMSMIGEDTNSYLMHFQPKGEYGKEKILITVGFTKEEAQEIFKYAVIK